MAGVEFSRLDVARGLATGDIDNDGDIDVVVTNNDAPVRLLLNQTIASPSAARRLHRRIGSSWRWSRRRATALASARASVSYARGSPRSGAACEPTAVI